MHPRLPTCPPHAVQHPSLPTCSHRQIYTAPLPAAAKFLVRKDGTVYGRWVLHCSAPLAGTLLSLGGNSRQVCFQTPHSQLS